MTRDFQDFTIRWHSVFHNPVYFIRKGLYNALASVAPLLRGKVLDFGCGSKPYRQLFRNASSYVGLDLAVSGHNQKHPEIDVYHDGKQIPFGDSTFDHVLSTEVLEHVFDIDEVLCEISRVLKPGGYLLITCPFVWPEHEKPYDYARYTSFGIKHLLEKDGFNVERQAKAGTVIETLSQLNMLIMYSCLPRKPVWLYLVLHQVFILPFILAAYMLGRIVPRLRRDDLYLSNIVIARKR